MNIDVLKNSILQMAIQGKLAPQDSNDEPASVLLEKIRAERERLIEEGKIKRPKTESRIFRRDGSWWEKKGDEENCIDEEIPFEIPESWEWARMGSLLLFINGDRGQNYPSKDKLKLNGKHPFISAINFNPDKTINKNSLLYLTEEQYNKLGSGKIENQDILLCIRGSLGKYAITNFSKGAIASSLVILRSLDKRILNIIGFFLDSNIFSDQILKYSNGTAQPNISAYDIKKFFIPLPPLAEQKRIADKLDEIFSHIASYKKTAAELLHLNAIAKKSILQHAIQGKLVAQDPNDEPASVLLEKIRAERERLIEEGKIKRPKTESRIFRRGGSWWEKNGEEENCIDEEITFEIPESWEWARLESLGQIIGGGTPDTKNKEYWENGDIAWITPADMKNVKNRYIDRGVRQITKLGLTNSSATLVPKNSLIYSTRAPIGHIAFAANSLATNQGFKTLVPYNFEIVHFMYYTIVYFTPEIQKRASGTTFKEISGFKYGQTLVPLPPLAEQKRIAEKLSQFMDMNEDLKAIL